jgi:hypothetical protein
MGTTPTSSIDRWIFHFGINAGQHMDYIGFLKHIKAIGKYWNILENHSNLFGELPVHRYPLLVYNG